MTDTWLQDAIREYVVAAAVERMTVGPELIAAKARCDAAAARILRITQPNDMRARAIYGREQLEVAAQTNPDGTVPA